MCTQTLVLDFCRETLVRVKPTMTESKNSHLISNIYGILPPFKEMESISNANPTELFIIGNLYKMMDDVKNSDYRINAEMQSNARKQLFMATALKDHLWEIINTGHYSTVQTSCRQFFTCSIFFKVFLQLILAHPVYDDNILDKCTWDLDCGLLLGQPLDKHPSLLTNCLQILQKSTSEDEMLSNEDHVLNVEEPIRDACASSDDGVAVLRCPSIETYQNNYFNKRIPVILTECINHWPALKLWTQKDYLIRMAGNRTVPIEIGQNYTTENWSQDLVKFRKFFERQLLCNDHPERIEYLAQHNLFEQIPELKNDIQMPEYCCVSDTSVVNSNQPDIKAWLGPKGTISPLHHDPKHNLLVQIFGHKRIILAASQDTENLYPHNGDMLSNTSQIDAENIDFGKFPLTKNVRFYTITLYKGEILYIPPKWWHYVRSLDKSFSVSFWWD